MPGIAPHEMHLTHKEAQSGVAIIKAPSTLMKTAMQDVVKVSVCQDLMLDKLKKILIHLISRRVNPNLVCLNKLY